MKRMNTLTFISVLLLTGLYREAPGQATDGQATAGQDTLLHLKGGGFLQRYYDDGGPEWLLDSAVFYEARAYKENPRYIDAYINAVSAYRVRWKHGLSRMVLMEALHHNPDNPEILTLVGRNFFDTGNPGLALPYLEEALDLGAPDIAYRFAGWCWFYLEQHGKQLEYFNRFRELDPESLMGIAGQVHSYTGLKQYDRAIELARQIRKDNPEYPYPAYLEAYIGETYLFAERFREAIPFYEKAYGMNPLSANLFATRAVTTTLGFLYHLEGKDVRGMELLEETIERRKDQWERMPERWEFSFDIASAFAAMGKREEAYQWLYTSLLTGYPGHLWYEDPVFGNYHDDTAFQQLIGQARDRVEAEISAQ